MNRSRSAQRHGRLPLAVLLATALSLTGCATRSDSQPRLASDAVVTTDDGVQIEVLAAGDGDEVQGSTDQQSLDTADAGPGATTGDGPPPFTVVASAIVPAVSARTAPSQDAEVVADFTNPTPTGGPLVFLAVDGGSGSSPDWIEVQLPVQPNGTTGWVLRSEMALSDNPYRVEIDRADYSLRVFDRNSLLMQTTIAVGNGATPTPVGEFYLLELLAPTNPDGPYGPFAFGLSGFSEVLTTFGGADEAIIGLHGTNDPASLGTDVSHGCIRLENEVIEELAKTLPLGTPVQIA